MTATAATTESLIARDDTFLGVCQGLAEDFGFSPTLLRIAFAVPLLFFPMATITAYLALGVVVLASRLLAPRPRRAPAATPQGEPLAADTVTEDQYPLPMAA